MTQLSLDVSALARSKFHFSLASRLAVGAAVLLLSPLWTPGLGLAVAGGLVRAAVALPLVAAAFALWRRRYWAARPLVAAAAIVGFVVATGSAPMRFHYVIWPVLFVIAVSAIVGTGQHLRGLIHCPLGWLALEHDSRRSVVEGIQERFRVLRDQVAYSYREVAPAGWLLCGTGGLIIGSSGVLWILAANERAPFGLAGGGALILAFAGIALGWAVFRAGLEYWARWRPEPRSSQEGTWVVLLRSFADDRLEVDKAADLSLVTPAYFEDRVRVESALAAAAGRIGQFVALGRPGEERTPLGATRQYLSHADWQPYVEGWMHRASCILVLVTGSAGVRWELSQVVRLRMLHKLVLVLPPVGDEALAGRLRDLAELRDQIPHLQAVPAADGSLPLAVCLSEQGVVACINGRKKDRDYEEAVVAACVVAAGRLPELSAAVRPLGYWPGRCALLVLARLGLLLRNMRLCLDSASAWTDQLRSTRMRLARLDLHDVISIFPFMAGLARIEVGQALHRDVQQLVMTSGLHPVVDLCAGDIESLGREDNWRLRATAHYYGTRDGAHHSDDADSAHEMPPTLGCQYCGVVSGLLRFDHGGAPPICGKCIELIDALMRLGRLPHPHVDNVGECHFCGVTRPHIRCLNSSRTTAICLRCVELPILAGDARAPLHKRSELWAALSTEDPRSLYWAMTRLLQTRNRAFTHRCVPRLLILLGNSSSDVRARAVDVCLSLPILDLSLTREVLQDARWEARANAALVLGLRNQTRSEQAATVAALSRAHAHERIDGVRRQIVESVRFLDDSAATQLASKAGGCDHQPQ